MTRLHLLVCAGVVFLACGGSGSEASEQEELKPPMFVSCMDASRGLCSHVDANLFEPAQVLALQMACLDKGGMVTNGVCPDADLVGTCGATQNGILLQVYYYASKYTAAEAQATCAQAPGAVWTPR